MKLSYCLNSESQPKISLATIAPSFIAHQLILNRKPKAKIHQLKSKFPICNPFQETNADTHPFSMQELTVALKSLKIRKAAGLDDITIKQLLQFDHKSKAWL